MNTFLSNFFRNKVVITIALLIVFLVAIILPVSLTSCSTNESIKILGKRYDANIGSTYYLLEFTASDFIIVDRNIVIASSSQAYADISDLSTFNVANLSKKYNDPYQFCKGDKVRIDITAFAPIIYIEINFKYMFSDKTKSIRYDF